MRKLAWQLLAPPPEDWDSFYRDADGTPTALHADRMAELARLTGMADEKPKKTKKKK
jgi:hypothetical protein